MLAVGVLDGVFVHGAYFRHAFPRTRIPLRPQLDRWYKLDLLLDWSAARYSILINDVEVVRGASMHPRAALEPGFASLPEHDLPPAGAPSAAPALGSVRLLVAGPLVAWWDEVFFGTDLLQGFRCPLLEPESADAPSVGPSVRPCVRHARLRMRSRARPGPVPAADVRAADAAAAAAAVAAARVWPGGSVSRHGAALIAPVSAAHVQLQQWRPGA